MRGVHVALERVLGRQILALGAYQVDRFDTELLEVGACRVEVVVRRHLVTRVDVQREHEVLCSAALVGRDDVVVSGDPANHLFEPIDALADRAHR
jgi:hypothetical protein